MDESRNTLSLEDVKRIVGSYKDSGVTDELYSFGSVLLAEVRNRAGRIDSKAATMLGWATGILAFLFTEIDKRLSGGFIVSSHLRSA